MMRLLRWAAGLVLALVFLVVLLLVPVARNELACRGPGPAGSAPAPIVGTEHQRAELRTLLTYPEWHIVNAYDDYAKVLETGDPHHYAFLRSVGEFWSSLCKLTELADSLHGDRGATMQMVYVIGVSFTAEWLAKAAYEETLGRAATWVRGADHAELDKLSTRQARDYADFLHQVPWYKWDFLAANAELRGADAKGFRNWERRVALGLENGFKSIYAGAIANAVAATGKDELTLRMVVKGLSVDQLTKFPKVKVIEEVPEGIIIETPRYRELTHLMMDLAVAGAAFIEIAGNNEIMVASIVDANMPSETDWGQIRQGYGDKRTLDIMDMAALSILLSSSDVEHVFDY